MKRLVGGVALMVLGMFMLLGYAGAELPHGPAVSMLTFGIAVLLPLLAGGGLVVSHYRRRHRLEAGRDRLARMSLEAEVLQLAQAKGGKLTAVEVMSDLAVDKLTADRLLGALAAQGMADVELTESGVMVFAFYDVAHLKDKPSARGVLDA